MGYVIHSSVNGIYIQVQPWCITDALHMCILGVYHNNTSVIHLCISNVLHGVRVVALLLVLAVVTQWLAYWPNTPVQDSNPG